MDHSAPTELDIIWDEPMKARCVMRSFDANGDRGLWMEAVYCADAQSHPLNQRVTEIGRANN